MTVTEIVTAARNAYNAVGDNFWSDPELYALLYDACLDMQRECQLIQSTLTTSTVASQQEYDFPTNTIAIKRITYEGQKLGHITMREDDMITGLNSSTTATGTPAYYFTWNEVIYLRPIPDSIGTLKIFSVNEPSAITSTSTIEIPTQFHMDLVKYMVMNIALKDQNANIADRYEKRWEQAKMNAKKWARKQAVADSFRRVQDEEAVGGNYFGVS